MCLKGVLFWFALVYCFVFAVVDGRGDFCLCWGAE